MSNEISSSTMRGWLDSRLADVPLQLAEAVRALSGESLSDGPEGLVTAALHGFDVVVDGTGSRPSALELLAADALLTYAFEAAADPSLEGSAVKSVRLAARVGPAGEIGARLAAASEVES